jgi:hypothetical protein
MLPLRRISKEETHRVEEDSLSCGTGETRTHILDGGRRQVLGIRCKVSGIRPPPLSSLLSVLVGVVGTSYLTPDA